MPVNVDEQSPLLHEVLCNPCACLFNALVISLVNTERPLVATCSLTLRSVGVHFAPVQMVYHKVCSTSALLLHKLPDILRQLARVGIPTRHYGGIWGLDGLGCVGCPNIRGFAFAIGNGVGLLVTSVWCCYYQVHVAFPVAH